MIVVRLDVMLATNKMSVSELADKIGISLVNVSLLKNGKVQGIRFSTLNKICEVLHCQPGEILEYVEDK